MAQDVNAQLRMQVQTLTAEAFNAKAEAAAAEELQQQLTAQHPHLQSVVEAALKRERALHDARNAKVLELLACKVQFLHGPAFTAGLLTF